MAREDDIRLIAYNLWEEEACPDGKDCEHWYRAEIIWQEQQKQNTVSKLTKSGFKQLAPQKSKVLAERKPKKS
jgi:hypothetical protein